MVWLGADSPASLLRVLEAMQAAGYAVRDLSESGDALLAALIDRCSYDTEILTEAQLAQAVVRIAPDVYGRWFSELPEKNRREIQGRWGLPPGAAYVHDGHLPVVGMELGNAFVVVQPPRGYGMDPNLIYHQPDLPPPHYYVALYRWLVTIARHRMMS